MSIKTLLENHKKKNGAIIHNAPRYIKNIYYKNKLYESNKNLVISEMIYSAKQKVDIKCTKCGYKWKGVVTNYTNSKYGCPSCSKNKPVKEEDFLKIMNDKFPNLVMVGEYINTKTCTEFLCKTHNYTYSVQPSNIMQGCGCKLCHYDRLSLTKEEFESRIEKLHKNVKVVGNFKGTAYRIDLKCNLDNHEWSPFAYALLSGQGCPMCAGSIKTNETFLKEIYHVYNGSIKVEEDYVSSSTKLKCYCNVCDYKFKAKPNSLLRGHGCPRCGHQDKDAIYYWKDDNGYYKIGVTRYSLKDSRVKCVANKRKTSINSLRIVKTHEARDLEKLLLSVFSNEVYMSGEGFTEFRELSEQEFTMLNEVFDEVELHGSTFEDIFFKVKGVKL